MGINLRIKRFNLQSQIHIRFPTLENQIQMNKFTDSFLKLIIRARIFKHKKCQK
jgi:hypothetical protein